MGCLLICVDGQCQGGGLEIHTYVLGSANTSLRSACAKGPFSLEAKEDQRGVIHMCGSAARIGRATPPEYNTRPRIHAQCFAPLYATDIKEANCRKGVADLTVDRQMGIYIPDLVLGPEVRREAEARKQRVAQLADQVGPPIGCQFSIKPSDA